MNIYAHTFTVYMHTYIHIYHTVCSVKTDFAHTWHSISRWCPVTTEEAWEVSELDWVWHVLTSDCANTWAHGPQIIVLLKERDTIIPQWKRPFNTDPETLNWQEYNKHVTVTELCALMFIQLSWNLRLICIYKLLFFIQAVRFYSRTEMHVFHMQKIIQLLQNHFDMFWLVTFTFAKFSSFKKRLSVLY